jgi:hypothetical protein
MTMKIASGSHQRNRSGQVVLEYVVTAGMLVSTVAIMAMLLYVFKENGSRVLEIMSSDYP